MDFSILMEYGWVLLVLVVLEGLLATDNALVLAIMVKHLPEEERRKALFYGLAGAFIFRFGSLFASRFLLMYGRFKQLVQHIFSSCALTTCLSILSNINRVMKIQRKKSRRNKVVSG